MYPNYDIQIFEILNFKTKFEIWKHGQLFGMQKNGQATNIQDK
jgi:hypothetical protein